MPKLYFLKNQGGEADGGHGRVSSPLSSLATWLSGQQPEEWGLEEGGGGWE